LTTACYSVFINVKLPVMADKLVVFGRYDHFDIDDDDDIADKTAYDMYVAGVSYNVYKGNMLMLAYETTDYKGTSKN